MFGDLFDEKPHLRMRRLEVDWQSLTPELLGRHRPDRGHHHSLEALANGCFEAHLAGHAQQVYELDSRRQNHDVYLASNDRLHGATKRCDILGHRPAINRHRDHLGSARRQPLHQVGIRQPVLLDCHTHVGEWRVIDAGIQRGQQFAPCVRARHGDPRRQPDFTKRGYRLGTARDDPRPGQRLNEGPAAVHGLDDLDQQTHADASHQDDHAEPTLDEVLGERQRLMVRLERHFAKRRRDDRRSPIVHDQQRELGRTAALERQHAAAVKAGSRRGASGPRGALLPDRQDSILGEARDGERPRLHGACPSVFGASTRESGSPSHTIPSSMRVG